MRNLLPLLAVAVLACSCSRSIAVNLQLVEPCDQKDQALNGVKTYSISSSDSEEEVTFKKDEGPPPLKIGLGDVMVTVKGFRSGADGKPQAVGHTVPLALTEQSPAIDAIVVTGKVDTFGKTTSADGECSSMTAEATVKGRHGHTATYVPVLNQVLILGGAVWVEGEEQLLKTAELWDPATGKFEEIVDPALQARAYHAASALPDGRVLISGGFGVTAVDGENKLVVLKSMLIFDPESKSFTVSAMQTARAHHTSTLLPGAGMVVLFGGCTGREASDGCTLSQAGSGPSGASTAVDPIAESFDADGESETTVRLPIEGATGRAFHQATALESGSNSLLVVTGGADPSGVVCQTEILRASSGTLERTLESDSLPGFPANTCPARHAAVAIDDQRIMIVGGQTTAPSGQPSGAGSASVFFFSTLEGVSPDAVATLLQGKGRAGALAAKLNDGSVLVVGGAVASDGATAEVVEPDLTVRALAGPPGLARDHAAMAILPNNEVLITGGYPPSEPLTTSNATELYFGE